MSTFDDLHAMPDNPRAACTPAYDVQVHGGGAREINVPLFRGPSTDDDSTGTGIRLESGTHIEVLPNGVAARWGEIHSGDELLTIGSTAYTPGTPLTEYLTEDKHYLVKVRRMPRQSLIGRAMCTLLQAEERAWLCEADVAQAWANAGDWNNGLR